MRARRDVIETVLSEIRKDGENPQRDPKKKSNSTDGTEDDGEVVKQAIDQPAKGIRVTIPVSPIGSLVRSILGGGSGG